MALISFRVDVYHHIPQPPEIPALITERLDTIMQTQAELAVALIALKDTNERDRAETLAKLAALQDAIDSCAATVDPAVLAAFNDLKASVDARDADVVPDPVEPEPEPAA